jgi:hypothetical protein
MTRRVPVGGRFAATSVAADCRPWTLVIASRPVVGGPAAGCEEVDRA